MWELTCKIQTISRIKSGFPWPLMRRQTTHPIKGGKKVSGTLLPGGGSSFFQRQGSGLPEC